MNSHEVSSSDFVDFRLSCASHYAILLKKLLWTGTYFTKKYRITWKVEVHKRSENILMTE